MDAEVEPLPHRTAEIEIQLLLEAIFQKYHYDFRGYSLASIKRRLTQARIHFGCENFSQLQDKILHETSALPKLLNFMTVQVSEMFRDPDYFLALRRHVLPHLKTYPSLKIWVAGCSSGEEVYSLAILLREEGFYEKSIIYATDINIDAIQKARTGIYDLERIKLFSENYQKSGGKGSLSDYYVADYGAAAFDKTLIDRVTFSDHSLVSDSVFGEMQLVSCRNVLIYFDRDLQNRVVGLFKDSLSYKGFLGLGSKESLRFNAHAADFSEFSRNEKIYQKKGVV